MIDTKFIHACDDMYMLESAYDENAKEIREFAGSLDVLTRQKRDLQMFGIFTESKEEYFVEGFSNIVETLGKKIIEIIQHFKDTMTDIFRKWKERSWQKKDDVQKLREIEKRNPKAAEKLQIAIEKGTLDMNSYKDIDSFFKEIDDILDNIDKANVDPKSLKGRLNKAKKKLEKNDNTIKAVASALGLVATTGTIVVTYQKYKNNVQEKVNHELCNTRNEATVLINKIDNKRRIIEEMAARGDEFAGSRSAMLAEATNELSRTTTVHCNKLLEFARTCESRFLVAAKSRINPGDDMTMYSRELSRLDEEERRLRTVRNNRGGN